MIFKTIISLLFLFSLCYCDIQYIIETRKVNEKPNSGNNNQQFAQNLAQAIKNSSQPQGYCTVENPQFPLNNRSLCGGTSDKKIGWIFTLKFFDKEGANYKIKYGTDFGYGAAVYVDGDLQIARTDDLWWDSKWTSDSVFTLDYDFKPGAHKIQVYGAQDCCDGIFDVQFSRNNSPFDRFSHSFLERLIPGHNGKPFMIGTNEPKVLIESRYGEKKATGSLEIIGENIIKLFEEAQQNVDGGCVINDFTYPIQNSSYCGAQENIHWRFVLNFPVRKESQYIFQFGMDMENMIGFQGQNKIYLNKKRIEWQGDWNSSSIFQYKSQYSPGIYQITIYGSEGCCNGLQAIRFSVDGGSSWLDATVENFNAVIELKPTKVIAKNNIPTGDCAILYSECNFQGQQLKVCQSVIDSKRFDFHSIYIPYKSKAIIYNQNFFQGQQGIFQRDVECMTKSDFQDPSFLSKNKIQITDKTPQEEEKSIQELVNEQIFEEKTNNLHLRRNY